MKFGLFGINMGPCSDPGTAVRVAQAAEAAGFESVWTGEHIVLPDPQVPPSPVPPESPFIDTAVALSFIAAHTRTIRLGTGIIILPQRTPVVLAKELASLDVLSNGRLTLGLEASKNLLRLHAGLDHFEGYRSSGLFLFGLIDNAHTSLAQETQNPVPPDGKG